MKNYQQARLEAKLYSLQIQQINTLKTMEEKIDFLLAREKARLTDAQREAYITALIGKMF